MAEHRLIDGARVALERELPGWRVVQTDDELTLRAPGLADGLLLELTVTEDEGELDAAFTLEHPVAQDRLATAHVAALVAIDRELELEADPDALARAAAAEAARLVAAGTTLDSYVALLVQEPSFRGDPADVLAAARGDARFPGQRPGPDWREGWSQARASVRARRDAVAAVQAQDLPDADARAAALAAELDARGREESPLWIRRHTEAEQPAASWRELGRDVRRLVGRFRDGSLGAPPPAVQDGAWRAVVLDPSPDPAVLTAAFAGAALRLGGVATVAGELTPDGAVVLGNTVIGRVDGDVAASVAATATRLQLGRVGGDGALFVQVQVPGVARGR